MNDSPKTEDHRHKAASLLNNVIELFGANIATKITSIIYTIAIVSSLSQEDYGLSIYASTIVGFLVLAQDMGLAQYAIRELASKNQEVKEILGTLFFVTAIFGLLFSVLVTGYAWFFQGDKTVFLIFLCAALVLIVNPFLVITSVVFNARMEMRIPSRVQVVIGLVKTIMAFPLFMVYPTAIAYLGLELVAATITAVILFWRLLKLKTEFNLTFIPPSNLLKHLKESWHFFASLAIFSIYNRADMIFLGYFRGPKELAIYGLSYRIFEAITLLGRPIGTVLFPAISQRKFDLDSMKRLITKSFHMTLGMGFLLGGTVFFLSDYIVLINKNYSQSVLIAKILLLSSPIYLGSYALMNGLNASGKQGLVTMTTAIGTFFNIFLNIIFIPKYGVIAAAIINSTTVLLFSTLYIIFLKSAYSDLSFVGKRLTVLLTSTFFSVLMGQGLSFVHPFLGTTLFAISFVLLAYIFFPFDEGEKQLLSAYKKKLSLKRKD